jgi:hypothetical protein
MILYQWDEQGFYVGSIEVDESAPMPERSTPTAPMKLTGTQVAQWQGQWVKLETRPVSPDPQPAPEPSVGDLRPAAIEKNNAAYEAAIGAMTSDYPAAEITTWERQRAEAVEWGADSASPTPWIDIAAQARGLDRDEYLARTLAKVNAFAVASAYLTGRRQGIDDQIRAATTAEELAAVVIDYTLPGA